MKTLRTEVQPPSGDELFTEEDPFVIVAIGKTEHDLAETLREIIELTRPYGEKVKVDGFVAPEKQVQE